MAAEACPAGDPNSAEIEALYPEGSSPEIRLNKLSSICSYGQTQLTMQGGLRVALTQHFADSQNILNASLRQRLERDGVWREDSQTGIVIESLHVWEPNLTEKRPALILKEGAWRWRQVGIGNRISEDYKTGRQTFAGLWDGSHVIFAIAKEPAEAQIIAIEALKCLLMYQDQIAEQFDLARFVPVSIGEVAALKESTENYVVPITVAYQVWEIWHLTPEAPRTKRIVWRASEVLSTY